MFFDGDEFGTDPASPVWSPEGRTIAFAMRPAGAADGESDIYVIDVESKQVLRLTETPGDDAHPAWSADGSRIFFNSARATPDPSADWSRQWHDIYSMAADGSQVRRHTDCRTVCTFPAPAPDGRRIAYRQVVDSLGLNWNLEPSSRNSEIFVAAIDGTDPINVSNAAAFDGWPTWTPDGEWIVFASNRAKVANAGQIYAIRPDGTDLRSLSDGALSRVQPRILPGGGEMLVYQSVEQGGAEFGHIARVGVDLP